MEARFRVVEGRVSMSEKEGGMMGQIQLTVLSKGRAAVL